MRMRMRKWKKIVTRLVEDSLVDIGYGILYAVCYMLYISHGE